MKECTKCGQLKSPEQFYGDSRHSDGKSSRCKGCHKETCVAWRKANPTRQQALSKAARKRNPGKVRADRAKRHAAKLRSTPVWLTKAQLKEIQTFYSNCPKGYEVDHIVPLRGRNVQGLHVIWNLQYLEKSKNRSKSNKTTVE